MLHTTHGLVANTASMSGASGEHSGGVLASHAERWLTPGTEYAVPEKLPLPAEWYKDWDASSADVDADVGATLSETGARAGHAVHERVGQNLPATACRCQLACGCAGDSKRPKRYFPFAEGPRNCVGQSLAKVSLAATMAILLQHFSFRLADEVLFQLAPMPSSVSSARVLQSMQA